LNTPLQYLTDEEAAKLAGINPDYNSADLYNAIEERNYPTWAVEIVSAED